MTPVREQACLDADQVDLHTDQVDTIDPTLPKRIPGATVQRRTLYRGVASVPTGAWRSHPVLTMTTATPDIDLLRRVAKALREMR